MTEPLLIKTMGARWRVDVSRVTEADADRLRVLWGRTTGWEPDPHEPPDFPRELTVTYPDLTDGLSDPLVIGRDIETASYTFSGLMTVRSLTAQAGRVTLLHSAALALPETGATVLLVAESGTGKTTAAKELGRHLGYLSDETAAIDADGIVIPHPKPLSVIPGPGEPKIEMAPDEVGLLPPPAVQPWVAATILLQRSPTSPGPLDLTPVDLPTALSEVIPQSSSVPVHDEPLPTLANVLTAGAGTFRLRYVEIIDAIGMILELLRGVAPGDHRPRDWERIAPSADRRTGPWSPSPAWTRPNADFDGPLERAPWRDALRDIETESIFVLNAHQPTKLMGLGATVWTLCESPQTPAQLLDEVIAQHGSHPQAADLVRQTIATLAAEGLLRAADPAAAPD